MDKETLRKILTEEPAGKISNLGIPCYNPYGDSIEVITENEPYMAYRVDKNLTVYNSDITGNTIGFKIKNVVKLIQASGADSLLVKAEGTEKGFNKISIRALLVASKQQNEESELIKAAYEKIESIPKVDWVEYEPIAA